MQIATEEDCMEFYVPFEQYTRVRNFHTRHWLALIALGHHQQLTRMRNNQFSRRYKNNASEVSAVLYYLVVNC